MAREDIAQDLKKQGFIKAITGSIQDAFDSATANLSTGMNRISSTVVTHTTEVMGSALNTMINDVKNLMGGAKDMLLGGWNMLFGDSGVEEDSLKEQKQQTSLLGKILDFFKNKDKMEKVAEKRDRMKELMDKMGGFLGNAAMFAGLLVGGAVGIIMAPLMGILKSFLIPFEVAGKVLDKFLSLGKWLFTKVDGLWKTFKEGKLFKTIAGLLETAKINFFKPIGTFFTKLIGIGKTIGGFFMNFPILGKFFAGFAKGFGTIMKGVPVIGWFITAIMGVIDFFKGFNETQGTFYEKLKAGITTMISGFFDPVFELIGWVSDKFLSLFGVEVEGGVASKLKGGFDSLVNGLFYLGEWIFNFFAVTIPDFFVSIVTKITDMWKSITDGGIIETVIDTLTNFAKTIKEFVMGLIPDFSSMRDMIMEKAKEYLPDWVVDKMKTENKVDVKSAETEVRNAELERNKATYEATKELLDEMKKNTKAVENQKVAQNTANVAQVNSNVTQGVQRPQEFREAPDEVENFGMIFLNKSTLGGAF